MFLRRHFERESGSSWSNSCSLLTKPETDDDKGWILFKKVNLSCLFSYPASLKKKGGGGSCSLSQFVGLCQ